MKFSLISLAVLLSTGLTLAVPSSGNGKGNSCFRCEYKQDDCGREYGGYFDPFLITLPCLESLLRQWLTLLQLLQLL